MKFNKEKLKSEVVLIFVFQVFWSKVEVVLKFGWCLKSEEYGKFVISSVINYKEISSIPLGSI